MLVGMIIVILLFSSYDDGKPNMASNTTSDTAWNPLPPVIVHNTVEIPAEPYLKTAYKTNTMKVDTDAIIAAYYTENRYNPSYKDSNIELNTDIAVFNNELKSFTFDYKINQKEKIITTTKTEIIVKKEVFSLQLGLGPSYCFKNRKTGGVVSFGTNFQRTSFDFKWDFTNDIVLGTFNYKFLKYSK